MTAENNLVFKVPLV